MKNIRTHSMIVGNKVLTNMTASEVKKLSAIMNSCDVDSAVNTIGIEEYICKYNPNVREWTSKKGTPMVTVEILHDVVDRSENEMSYPKDCMFRNYLFLK